MNHSPLAGSLVVAAGALWGLYWMPLRQLEALGAAGSVGRRCWRHCWSPACCWRRRPGVAVHACEAHVVPQQ
ncbi:MAG: hypothetical protein U5K33_05995 [Halofilum sp. (in: g-proteobacteria)]|nr:hypothetical protein [Halofilum sp. (in: g-proteobacteria)]